MSAITDNPLNESQDASNPVADKPSVAKPRKRSWRKFARDLFLYVVAYVVISGIAIGPLFWVWFGDVYVYDGSKWIARIFLPLALLCELIPPLSWLVNAWVNWWIL
jgi:hypothetical protein